MHLPMGTHHDLMQKLYKIIKLLWCKKFTFWCIKIVALIKFSVQKSQSNSILLLDEQYLSNISSLFDNLDFIAQSMLDDSWFVSSVCVCVFYSAHFHIWRNNPETMNSEAYFYGILKLETTKLRILNRIHLK